MTFKGGIEPLARSGAVGILQNDGSFEHVGLLEIVGRHGDAPAGGAGMQRGDQRAIAAQLQVERFRDRLASQVVFRGAKATDDDEDVNASEGRADGVDDVFFTIANNGFEGDGDAEFVELFRQVERVGVLAGGREHFRADGDNFGFHGQVTDYRLQVTDGGLRMVDQIEQRSQFRGSHPVNCYP